MECPTCNREFDQPSNHWRQSDCPYPELSEGQMEVLRGVLMGDGSVIDQHRHPRFQVSVVKEEYLEYLDSLFPLVSSGVSLKRDASAQAQSSRDSGINPDAKAESYSDLYTWRTVSLPQLREFRDWYSSGKKVWPDDVDLTPTVMRHWYVCDGTLVTEGKYTAIEFGVWNERQNRKKVEEIFGRAGFTEPYWRETPVSLSIRLNPSETRKAFEYMGPSPPGFSYKWTDDGAEPADYKPE